MSEVMGMPLFCCYTGTEREEAHVGSVLKVQVSLVGPLMMAAIMQVWSACCRLGVLFF